MTIGPSFKLYYYKVIGNSGLWADSNITYTLNSEQSDPIPAIYEQLGNAVTMEISRVFQKSVTEIDNILNEIEEASVLGINNILRLDRDPASKVPSEMIAARNQIDQLKNSSTSTNIKQQYEQSIESSKILSNAFTEYAQKFKKEVAGKVFEDVNVFNNFKDSKKEIQDIINHVDRIKKNNEEVKYSVNKLQGSMFEFASGAGMAMLDTYTGKILPKNPFSNIRFSGYNKKADLRVDIKISGTEIDLGFSIKSSIKSDNKEFKAHGGYMGKFLDSYPDFNNIINKINIYSTNNDVQTEKLKKIFSSLLADPIIGGFEHGQGRSDMPERALVLINLKPNSAGHVVAKAQFLNRYFLSSPSGIRSEVGKNWFLNIKKSGFYGTDTKYYTPSI